MGFITVLLYIILSLAVGTLLVGISINLFSLSSLDIYLNTQVLANAQTRLTVALLGLVIILFSLRYIQTIFTKSRKKKSITFESPQGVVSITLLAIEDMLKKMLEEKTEVSHVRPKVILKKKNIEVLIRGVLLSEVNLVEFTSEIQEKIKEKMNTLLGEDKQVRVNLEIRKVALTKQDIKEEALDPEIPFRNYE